MAELLLRRWNVAIPEVDVGDDIFVVRHETRELRCVQVKTSLGASGGFQFNVALQQIESVALDPLFFVFVLRVGSGWSFLVFRRTELEDLYSQQHFGTLVAKTGAVLFRVKLDPARTTASGSARTDGGQRVPAVDLSRYLAAWDVMFPAT